MSMRLIDRADTKKMDLSLDTLSWYRVISFVYDDTMTLWDRNCLHSDPFQFYKDAAKNDGPYGVACSDDDGDVYIDGGMMHNTLKENAFICGYCRNRPLKNRALNEHSTRGTII